MTSKLVLVLYAQLFSSRQLEKILAKVAEDVQSLHASGASNSVVHWGVGISAAITFLLLCLRLAGVPIPERVERALEVARALLSPRRGIEPVAGFAAAGVGAGGAHHAAQSEFTICAHVLQFA